MLKIVIYNIILKSSKINYVNIDHFYNLVAYMKLLWYRILYIYIFLILKKIIEFEEFHSDTKDSVIVS